MSQLDDSILSARKVIHKDRLPAVLGDGTGQPRAGEGLYWVRKVQAAGVLSTAFKLPLAPGVSLTIADGVPVELGYDTRGNQCIYPVNADTLNAANISPYLQNPLEQAVYEYIATDKLVVFLCRRHNDTTNKPLTVVVFVPFVLISTTLTPPTLLEIDFTGNVPASGLHGYAVVCWKTDNTLEVKYSTAKSTGDPLTEADLQEAIITRTSGAIPVWAWAIGNAQSALTADPTKNVDLRQWITGNGDHNQLTGLQGGTTSEYYHLSATQHASLPGITYPVGTVTSVGLSEDTDFLGVSGSPVTSSGTLALVRTDGLTANQVLASPNGATGKVSLRALVAADIPMLGTDKLAVPFHVPVRLIATANQSISSAPATIDTITPSTGDRLLFINQTTVSQNGLWVYQGVGNPLTRPTDYAAGSVGLVIYGMTVYVIDGTTNNINSVYRLATTGTITVDTTSTSWTKIAANLSSASGILTASNGGTGTSSLTSGGLVVGNGTGVVNALAPDGEKHVVISNATPAWTQRLLAVGDLPFAAAAFQLLRTNAAANAAEWGQIPYIQLQDQKATTTQGGTFTSGALRTRTLNTEVTDTDNLCSLNSNQFTLAAGTYLILATVPAHSVDRHQAVLRNVTGSSTLLIGQNSAAGSTLFVTTPSVISGQFTVAASQALEIQHRCQTTGTTTGFGSATSFGGTEVYTDVQLWRLGP